MAVDGGKRLIVGYLGSGARQFLNLLRRLAPEPNTSDWQLVELELRAYSQSELSELLSGSEKLVLFESSYRSLLCALDSDLLADWESLLRGLIRSDAMLTRIVKEHGASIRINRESIEDQASLITKFCKLSPDALDLTELAKVGELPDQLHGQEEKIQLLQDRRSMQFAGSWLSGDAIRATKLDGKSLNLNLVDDDLDEFRSHWVVLCDARVDREQLRQFVSYEPSGLGNSNLVVIYSHFSVIRPFLEEAFYWPYLDTGVIKLWHITEWTQRYIEQFQKSIRTTLLVSGVMLPSPQKQVSHQFVETAKQTLSKVTELCNQAHERAKEYYASEAFRERLKQVANGATLRILVEQVCTSVFVKQFSRAMARELEAAGYEVFLHETCGKDQGDNHMANILDLAEFLPDLLIRSPNSYDRSPYQNIPGLPVIIPLQDHEPHMHFAPYVEKNPLGPYSMVLLIEDRFYEPIREAGVAEDQVFFDFLPVDEPPSCVDDYEQRDIYDIGFVKTMTHDLELPDITEALSYTRLKPEERKELETNQARVLDRIRRFGFVDFRECRMWSPTSVWLNGCVTFTHERLCEHFISSLAEEGYSLGLTGNNWSKFPHLAQYGLGYARSREAYYRRFFDNKINLSINPWDIYHPRILEGGWCGGFFLIHKMPDDVAWQHLPPSMVPGEHFDYFENKEELKEKVKFYLQRDDLRRQIGQNLKELVREQFTYSEYRKVLMDRFYHLLETRGPDPFPLKNAEVGGVS